jgi:hypothetical protein
LRHEKKGEPLMIRLKTLGLALIAANILLAFVGAGSAAGTTLFTDAAHSTAYGTGTHIDATLKTNTSSILETTGGASLTTCTSSTVTGSSGTASGTWVAVGLTAINWNECDTTTDTLVTGSLEIMWTSGSNGEVIARNTEVTHKIFGVSCIYGAGAGTNLGTITGGTEPELSINAAFPRVTDGSFLCPSTALWTATYVVTSPHALFPGS